jgi:hypothetical protein
MLDRLNSPQVWRDFLEYRRSGGHMSAAQERALAAFIEAEAYRPVVERIRRGETFAPPKKSAISKKHSAKKRIVYTYAEDENWVLKLLTHLLQGQYDHLFADNLYSFRQGTGVRDAIRRLTGAPDIRRMWSYKVDISNYFNSVPVDRVRTLLGNTLADEPETARFLESLLMNPLVEDNGAWVPEEKGIMAGTPISTFLANLYLAHMDHYFADAGVLYARYSDDIIVFAPAEEVLVQYIAKIRGFLSEAGLSVNSGKEERRAPGEMWTYLGVCFRDGVVDVAPVSVEKLKAKMRRKARALVRWQARKELDGVQAAKAFVRVFNRKLFENDAEHELTWVRWYFPLINTADSLKIIDAYSQQCIRFLATGRHTKAAYNFRYADMKALGYRSLVHEYYKKDDKSQA